MDMDAIIERAAIIEYDASYSRYMAEKLAAQEFGFHRWEIFGNENGNRNSSSRADNSQANNRDTKNGMSKMQPHSAQQKGQVLVSVICAGWCSCLLSSLQLVDGAIL